jgi:hypothetical protein
MATDSGVFLTGLMMSNQKLLAAIVYALSMRDVKTLKYLVDARIEKETGVFDIDTLILVENKVAYEEMCRITRQRP